MNAPRLFAPTKFVLCFVAGTCCHLISSASALAVNPPPGGGYPNEVTALGQDALFSLTPGSLGMNTAVGFDALYDDTTGYEDTAVGDSALYSNTTGFANVASGDYALYSNTTGARNTAIGSGVMVNNTVGYRTRRPERKRAGGQHHGL